MSTAVTTPRTIGNPPRNGPPLRQRGGKLVPKARHHRILAGRGKTLETPSAAPAANLLAHGHIQTVMPNNGNVALPAHLPSLSGRDAVVPNHLLRSIPKTEYDALFPHLEQISLPWHQVLHESRKPIAWGYFPNGGVVSLIVRMNDGKSAEVGMVGREGFVGIPLAGGLDRSPHLAMVQVAALAMRVEAAALQSILPSAPRMATLLTRYALVQGMQFAQTAACNRLHNLEQRLARWLLMSQDRVCSNTLPYTHDLLAVMLGTDRPSVSVAMGELQVKGSIQHARGKVEILNRSLLKRSSCECYQIIQEYNTEFELELAASRIASG